MLFFNYSRERGDNQYANWSDQADIRAEKTAPRALCSAGPDDAYSVSISRVR